MEKVTGRLPEGYVRPQVRPGTGTIQKAYVQPVGRSAITSLTGGLSGLLKEGGSLFTTRPRETNVDKAQRKTKEGLRVSFDGPVNESAATTGFREAAEYDMRMGFPDSEIPTIPSFVVSTIEYDSKRFLLRIRYANNGAVVVYFRVPPSVYGRLLYCAKSGGEGNFSIGGNIWNMLRQYDRGQLKMGGPYHPKQSSFVQRGGKVGFVYEQEGISHDTGGRERYQAERKERVRERAINSVAGFLEALHNGDIDQAEVLKDKALETRMQEWLAQGKLTRKQVELAFAMSLHKRLGISLEDAKERIANRNKGDDAVADVQLAEVFAENLSIVGARGSGTKMGVAEAGAASRITFDKWQREMETHKESLNDKQLRELQQYENLLAIAQGDYQRKRAQEAIAFFWNNTDVFSGTKKRRRR